MNNGIKGHGNRRVMHLLQLGIMREVCGVPSFETHFYCSIHIIRPCLLGHTTCCGWSNPQWQNDHCVESHPSIEVFPCLWRYYSYRLGFTSSRSVWDDHGIYKWGCLISLPHTCQSAFITHISQFTVLICRFADKMRRPSWWLHQSSTSRPWNFMALCLKTNARLAPSPLYSLIFILTILTSSLPFLMIRVLVHGLLVTFWRTPNIWLKGRIPKIANLRIFVCTHFRKFCPDRPRPTQNFQNLSRLVDPASKTPIFIKAAVFRYLDGSDIIKRHSDNRRRLNMAAKVVSELIVYYWLYMQYQYILITRHYIFWKPSWLV